MDQKTCQRKVNVTNSLKDLFISFTMYYEILERSMSVSSDHLLQLADVSSNGFQVLKENPDFIEMFQALMPIAKSIESGKREFSKREVLPLLPSLENLCDSLAHKLTFSISGSSKLRNYYHAAGCCADSQNAVRILLAESENVTSVADFVITPGDIENVAMRCWPFDRFSYLRLRFLGKMKLISQARDVRCIAVGNSHIMGGFLESPMPVRTVNFGADSQDIYYSLLCAERAVDRSAGIKYVVLPMDVIMAEMDLSCDPTDFNRSVLTKVCIPVFQDRHGYSGDLPALYPECRKHALYQRAFDMKSVREDMDGRIMDSVAKLDFYNDRFFPRKPNGLLPYNFREVSDEQNMRAAKFRFPGKHDFLGETCRANRDMLDRFLIKMAQRGITVILFNMPMTRFFYYGVGEDNMSRFRNIFIRHYVDNKNCIFMDFLESPLFDHFDFHDYDHLNQQGAEKLTGFIGQKIVELESQRKK